MHVLHVIMKKEINIAWLKRDLRTSDNLVLDACEQDTIPYVIIYIFDPDIINSDNISKRHLKFIYHSISGMNTNLEKYNRCVKLLYGSSIEIFKEYFNMYDIKNIFAYQESGIRETYIRDLEIKKISSQNNTNFIEFEKDGVERGIKNRSGWDSRWYVKMKEDLTKNVFTLNSFKDTNNNFNPPKSFINDLSLYPKEYVKPGYESAIKTLSSFLESRSQNYNKHISKPLASRKSCSRISPYLSWGNISSKQVYHFLKNHKKIKGISSFLTRLKWRSHFIQKFESEYQISYRCANKVFEKMRYENNPELIYKWKSGKTGFPLVDANMICLRKTGWINFRMRAMLVSIFSYQFDCNWKLGARYLAELFLDYEPGIHFSQFQMQSGTTGINTIRMYNPIKQSYDHDADGLFIKQWIPELENVPKEYIHEPWKMPPLINTLSQDSIYNNPCVNIAESGKAARSKIWSFKASKEVKIENKRILRLHVRNNNRRLQN